MIEKVLRRQGLSRDRVWGIGMGISGVVDRQNGLTLMWPKVPHWVDVPVRRILADEFRTPVEIDDSARTMALAERRFGVAAEARQFIYVMLGAGTGSALFLNGELYTGAAGFAGEFGHITVEENGPPCSCGNRGCLEALASASALIAQARAALRAGLDGPLWRSCGANPDALSIASIAQAARESDRFSAKLLGEAGMHIGIAVVSLVNLLNPELIVFGGGLASAASEFLLPEIERAVRERAVERAAATVKIRFSAASESDWARGAALHGAGPSLDRLVAASLGAGVTRRKSQTAGRTGS